MKNRMKRTHCIAAVAVFLAASALTGCLRFENSMDLSVPITTGTGVGVTSANEQTGTTAAWDTTAAPDGTTSVTPTADAVSAAADQTSAVPAESTTAALPAESTTANAGTESTTAGTTPESTTGATAPESTTAAPQTPAQYAKSLGNTEYDVLRSNAITLDATLGDSTQTTPVRMSIGDGKVYILSEMDGLTMGVYIEGKKTYIYLPSQKKYLKLNGAVAKLMGIDPNEFSDMAEDMGFDSLPPLTDAYSVSDGKMNGVSCKLFLLKSKDDTVIRVGLNGKKLVGLEYLDAAGKTESYMYFNSITSGFPTMPPDGYEEMGYMEFAKLLMAEMDEEG